uniref:Uncharacterized protein n=1 Tax=Mola mola TaxID=94237 RepID=A0A3Q3X6N1_MOLML
SGYSGFLPTILDFIIGYHGPLLVNYPFKPSDSAKCNRLIITQLKQMQSKYHLVINNFINSLCVELRPASDHFISSAWVRYCSGSIINLIYIWPLRHHTEVKKGKFEPKAFTQRHGLKEMFTCKYAF